MPYFGMTDESDTLVFLKVYYYAFTSLTTVGLGDLRPVSELEQLFCGFMLVSGVPVPSLGFLLPVPGCSAWVAPGWPGFGGLCRWFSRGF